MLHRNIVIKLYSATMAIEKQNIILNVCVLNIFYFQNNNILHYIIYEQCFMSFI